MMTFFYINNYCKILNYLQLSFDLNCILLCFKLELGKPHNFNQNI